MLDQVHGIRPTRHTQGRLRYGGRSLDISRVLPRAEGRDGMDAGLAPVQGKAKETGQPELSDVFSYDQRLASGTSFIWPQSTIEISSSLRRLARSASEAR